MKPLGIVLDVGMIAPRSFLRLLVGHAVKFTSEGGRINVVSGERPGRAVLDVIRIVLALRGEAVPEGIA